MPRATLYIVDIDNVWLRNGRKTDVVLDYVCDENMTYWVRTPSDERGIPIWHIYQEDDLEIRDSRPQKKEEQRCSLRVAVAANIGVLNHLSQYYFFDNTPEGQRFSYEVKSNMGSRKLKGDR